MERLPDQDLAVWAQADALFPVRVPRGWFDQIDPGDPADPLRVQALPDPRELQVDPADLPDPVGEQGRMPVPWVISKHPDRALLLLTTRCHLYCRYCFRRSHPHHGGAQDPTDAELERALAWCRAQGVRELILSGGDPLAVRDERLFAVIDAARPQIPVIRVHTRAPLTAPHRVTPALVAGLAARRPVWVLVHCNHARELGAAARGALRAFVDAGLPVLNQAVLLRGVNDQVEALQQLCEELVALGVFPYYLHHTDRAPGNAHLRVDPARGLVLHAELARRVSGLALPRYVVDLPDGSGKMSVAQALREGRLAADEASPPAAAPTPPEQEVHGGPTGNP